VITGRSSYKTNTGTSFSTPIVSGAIAIILEAHPHWGPRHVREALLQTAHKADSPDVSLGWGLVDAVAAFNYQPVVTCGDCVHGHCANEDISDYCECESGYYGANCEVPILECEDFCGDQGRCYEGHCLCLGGPLSDRDRRCLSERIPGWSCPVADYNDGKRCQLNCGTPDPDCRGATKLDCPTAPAKGFSLDNFPNYCPDFGTAMKPQEESPSQKQRPVPSPQVKPSPKSLAPLPSRKPAKPPVFNLIQLLSPSPSTRLFSPSPSPLHRPSSMLLALAPLATPSAWSLSLSGGGSLLFLVLCCQIVAIAVCVFLFRKRFPWRRRTSLSHQSV